jgi:cardiolipin synthase A/B
MPRYKLGSFSLTYLSIAMLCLFLISCNISIGTPTSTSTSGGCQSNCSTGSGTQGVQVFVEPDAGEHPITNAIEAAKKSVWLEMYWDKFLKM